MRSKKRSPSRIDGEDASTAGCKRECPNSNQDGPLCSLPDELLMEILPVSFCTILWERDNDEDRIRELTSGSDESGASDPSPMVVLRTCHRFWSMRADVWIRTLKTLPTIPPGCHHTKLQWKVAIMHQAEALYVEGSFCRKDHADRKKIILYVILGARRDRSLNAALLTKIITSCPELSRTCLSFAAMVHSADACRVVLQHPECIRRIGIEATHLDPKFVDKAIRNRVVLPEDLSRKKETLEVLLSAIKPRSTDDYLLSALQVGEESICLKLLQYQSPLKDHHLEQACRKHLVKVVDAMLARPDAKHLDKTKAITRAEPWRDEDLLAKLRAS